MLLSRDGKCKRGRSDEQLTFLGTLIQVSIRCSDGNSSKSSLIIVDVTLQEGVYENYKHFNETRIVDFAYAPKFSCNLNYISQFIQCHMSQTVTSRDLVESG